MGRLIACFVVIVAGFWAYTAKAETVIHGSTSTGPQPFATNSSGQVIPALLACEDQTNGVCRVEIQGSGADGVTSDSQMGAAGARFLYSVTCSGTDAAAEAGSMTIRNSTSAGAGTVVQTIGFAAAYFAPVTLWFNRPFSTGIYFDFTTTTDVMCSASYR